MEALQSMSSTSKEENTSQYIILLSQLEISIQAFDSLHECAKICKEINERSHKIGKIDFSYFKDRPFQDTNIVIFTCKYGRRDILNYILSEDANILFNVTERIGISAIHPDDRDAGEKDAFYYSMKSPKTDLLELLIQKWQQGLTPEQLDELLSSALKELKLRNVSISTEVEIFVESRLVEFRFYEPTKPNQPKQKRVFNPTPVLQRIDLVLEKIEFALALATPGASFSCALKQIALSVHALKRQLRPTYDSIPWEEIEFYLATFIGCNGEPKELSMFHGSALSQKKICQLLGDLSQSLLSIKRNASVLTGKFLFPKMTREEMKKSVIQKSTFSEEFYDDFENLRDFVTLETMSKYMRIAMALDAKEPHGKVILARCLQVIGEHLKNTVESPKLSEGAGYLLLSSLPHHTSEVLKRLRDALSHDHALEVREELEENTHAFFEKIQIDLQKLVVLVEVFKYKKKVSQVQKLFEAITRCNTVQEMRDLVEARDINQIEDAVEERFLNFEVERIESLVHSARSHLEKMTNNEDLLFTDIHRFLQAEKDKLMNIQVDFKERFKGFRILIQFLQKDCQPQYVRDFADSALKMWSLMEVCRPNLDALRNLLRRLWYSTSQRLMGKKMEEYRFIMVQLSRVLDFDLVNMRWVHEFRNRLDSGPVQKKKKKATGLYGHLLTKKTKMLQQVLKDNRLERDKLCENILEYKKDEKLKALVEMLLLDIMSIFQSNGRLSENPYFLDSPHPSLLGQNLRKHLAHENVLVRELTDVDVYVLLVSNTVVNASNNVDQTDKVLINDPLLLRESGVRDLRVCNQERLFEALEAGDVSLVRKFVAAGADMDGRDSKGRTALHYASTVECAKFAVESGVKAATLDQFKSSALHSAALNGRVEVVCHMIDQLQMKVGCTDDLTNTPLHLAAENGHCAVVEALLKRGASTGAKDAAFNTPLHSAVAKGHLQTAKILLKQEVHVDTGENLERSTALHISAERGFKELVSYLLECGAEVNLRTEAGLTALHKAALTGHVDVVKILLSCGARVSISSVLGYTPAHLAAENGHAVVLGLLYDNGCKLDDSDEINSRTPLHLSALNGHVDAARVLIDKGCNVERKDVLGLTPLHLACYSGSEDVVKMLLDSKACVDARTKDGETPLQLAAASGSLGMMKFLLERGANANAIDYNRRCSVLHLACVNQSKVEVELLLEKGAKVDVDNSHGDTPLFYSIISQRFDIATVLIKHGANIYKQNATGFNALSFAAIGGQKEFLRQFVSPGDSVYPNLLSFACFSGKLDVVQFLLDCGLDVNSLGSSPLHEAVQGNHEDLVKLLIRLRADTNAKNQTGLTPIVYAVELNFKNIAEILRKGGAEVDYNLLMMAVKHGGDILNILLKDNQLNLEEGTILLHEACKTGMKTSAEVLMSMGVSVNCVDDKGFPLLYSTVASNQQDIVEYLLYKGANPDDGPGDGTTPLQVACQRGYVKTVAALLRAGSRLEEKVLLMAMGGQLEIFKMLEKKADIENVCMKLLLQEAVMKGNSDIVKHLVKDKIERGLIHLAAMKGHWNLVTFFLDSGLADVNERTESEETILQYAAYGKHSRLVNPLLDRGAQVDGADALGSTPAHVAASQGNVPFLRALLQRGAVHDPLNCRGFTPLQVAEASLKSEVITMLRDTSQLFAAVQKNDLIRTKDLLENGAASNATGRDGVTPLHLASLNGNLDIVRLFLKNGGHPNTKCRRGFSSLHCAAKQGHTGVVVALLKAGARYDVRSVSDKTPLNLAKRPSQALDLLDLIHRTFRSIWNGECGILEELKSRSTDWVKAVLRCRDFEDRTLLVTAIRCDFPRVKSLKNLLLQICDNPDTMVSTFKSYREFPRLLNLFRMIYCIRLLVFGPESPCVLDMVEEIAITKDELGQTDDTLSVLESVLQKRKDTVGMGEDILHTQKHIASLLFNAKRYEESLQMYQELYRKQLKISGPLDAAALSFLLQIAINMQRLSRYEETLRICDKFFETVQKPWDHSFLPVLSARALVVKASVLMKTKDFDRAHLLLEDSYKVLKKVFRRSHPVTIYALNLVIQILEIQGKHSQALTVCKEIIDAQSSNPVHDPSAILKTSVSLGNIFMNLGLHFEAYKTFKSLLNQGYQDDQLKEKVEILEVRYAFVFPSGGIEMVLKEPTGVFEEGGDLRRIDAAELRRRDSLGRTALHHCVMTGDEAGLRLLLRRGVDVLMTDHGGETPLQLATRLGKLKMAEILRHPLLLSVGS